MSVTDNPLKMFSERSHSYARFIRSLAYPQGLRNYFYKSALLADGLKVLDAGCGTGVVMLGFRDALLARGFRPGTLHGLDLTPAMMDRFRETMAARQITDIRLAQCNVLKLDELAPDWKDYDRVISASMLEYVPRERFVDAIAGLRDRLKPGGTFTLFMTRRNLFMHPLIGHWWQSNLYSRDELQQAFGQAGYTDIAFRRFSGLFVYLNLWGYVVEARRPMS